MKIAADANVLLSAVLGGRARLILEHPTIEKVFTAEEAFAEVQEYAAILAKKKRLTMDLVLLAVDTLPVTVVERHDYRAHISEAFRMIGKRDPDDVPILALALSLQIPVWSNDRDFEATDVEWYTTESLLRRLGIIGNK